MATSTLEIDDAPRRSFVKFVGDWLTDFGAMFVNGLTELGSFSLFVYRTVFWLFTRLPKRETLLPCFYHIGVRSMPVVALTGTFIGMVLVVQTFVQFRMMNMETKLGAVINMSLVRELGPVLAATMLAGRVGGSMAAELGTMRVTEQIDALSSMGANPIHYLVVPRFLACLLLIPALTLMADFMGAAGAFFYAVGQQGIDWHHYMENSQRFVGLFDVSAGVFKSLFFGAAIALIACHRGFHCEPGAEGVGRAATKAFVASFVAIMLLNLLLGMFLDGLYYTLWPEAPKITS
jgi:phospholipid/cholesterol/gamma-HCH transport system permease protein